MVVDKVVDRAQLREQREKRVPLEHFSQDLWLYLFDVRLREQVFFLDDRVLYNLQLSEVHLGECLESQLCRADRTRPLHSERRIRVCLKDMIDRVERKACVRELNRAGKVTQRFDRADLVAVLEVKDERVLAHCELHVAHWTTVFFAN